MVSGTSFVGIVLSSTGGYQPPPPPPPVCEHSLVNVCVQVTVLPQALVALYVRVVTTGHPPGPVTVTSPTCVTVTVPAQVLVVCTKLMFGGGIIKTKPIDT